MDKTNMPPIDDTYRWKVKRCDGHLLTGPYFEVSLQKRKFGFWKTVSGATSLLADGEVGIAEAASRAFYNHSRWEEAEPLEGIRNGNSEYREK